MKSTVDQLSTKDRALLAAFYGTDTYEALKKLVAAERVLLAQDAIDQTDILQVRYLSGQSISLKKLFGTLKVLYKPEKPEKPEKKSWL